MAAIELHGFQRHAPFVAVLGKGCNGFRVHDEDIRHLPYTAQHVIQQIRRRAAIRFHLQARGNVIDQAPVRDG